MDLHEKLNIRTISQSRQGELETIRKKQKSHKKRSYESSFSGGSNPRFYKKRSRTDEYEDVFGSDEPEDADQARPFSAPVGSGSHPAMEPTSPGNSDEPFRFSDGQEYPDIGNTCYLCAHVFHASDNMVIRSIWQYIRENIDICSFQQLARGVRDLWNDGIVEPEQQLYLRGARRLQKITASQCYTHITDPEHMGSHPMIILKKLRITAIQNMNLCDEYKEYIDDNGNRRPDCKVLGVQLQYSKHLSDLYKLDPREMYGYSDQNFSAERSKIGDIQRIVQ